MRFFTGQFDRTIDAKNRLQLPSQIRSIIDPDKEGTGMFVLPGESPGTLSLFTQEGFEELAARMETEFMSGPESRQFELQFFSLASHVDVDKQGRFVLPERLLKMSKLASEVVLVGQKNRVEVWNRDAFETSLGIDWAGKDWPDWQGFLRMRPKRGPDAS